jgi:hypothetical protein
MTRETLKQRISRIRLWCSSKGKGKSKKGAGQSTTISLQASLQAAIPAHLVATSSTSLLYKLTDVKPYNLNIAVEPVAVTYPETTAHVQAIIKCAAANKVNVQARGGGHGYANYGEFEFC